MLGDVVDVRDLGESGHQQDHGGRQEFFTMQRNLLDPNQPIIH